MNLPMEIDTKALFHINKRDGSGVLYSGKTKEVTLGEWKD